MVSTNPPKAPGGWRQNRSIVLAAILVAQMMVVLDATIVNVALPHIQRSLHFSASSLSWVLNAYVLTFGGLLMLGARSGDLLGRRRVFLAGVGLFSISSLAGGFATDSWQLLAARAVQGVGGALAAPTALALLTAIFPEGPERIRAIGLYTTVSAAGGVTGLVAGGLITEWASWRWVMFVNFPIGIAVLAAGWATLVETPTRRGRFDLAGAFTSTVGMTAVVLGLIETADSGWTSARAIGPLAAGVVLLAAFLRIERTAPEPVLPLRVLAHRTRGAANAARALGYAGMYGMTFFLTQFLQEVQHRSAIVTGLMFVPTPTSVFLSSQLTSRYLSSRFAPRTLMMTGAGLVAFGMAAATQLHAGSPYPQLLLTLLPLGWGMGISFVSLTTAALDGLRPTDIGAASGMVNVSQQVGAALGLAVMITVADAVHSTGSAAAVLVHRMDTAFALGAGFALTAVLLVAALVRTQGTAPVPRAEEALDLEVAA